MVAAFRPVLGLEEHQSLPVAVRMGLKGSLAAPVEPTGCKGLLPRVAEEVRCLRVESRPAAAARRVPVRIGWMAALLEVVHYKGKLFAVLHWALGRTAVLHLPVVVAAHIGLLQRTDEVVVVPGKM